MKKGYYGVFIAVLLIIAIAAFYLSKDSGTLIQNPGTNATTTIEQGSGIYIAPIINEYASSTYAEMSLSYPKSDMNSLPEIFDLVQATKNEFWGQYGSLTPAQAKEMQVRGENQFQLYVSTRIATSSKSVSYIVQVYQYLGGAHGGTLVYTYTYTPEGRRILLDKIFKPGYLAAISSTSRKYFYKTLGEYLQPQAVDEGTAPKDENFTSWYLTDDAVVFIFGQYQVGPYALGILEYPARKEDITGFLKPDFK